MMRPMGPSPVLQDAAGLVQARVHDPSQLAALRARRASLPARALVRSPGFQAGVGAGGPNVSTAGASAAQPDTAIVRADFERRLLQLRSNMAQARAQIASAEQAMQQGQPSPLPQHEVITKREQLYNRGVNRAEISGPARKNFFFGPARNQCIIKFLLYNFFEILQQNQYNYIKLHSSFPLVQLLYCPSTTVMYNVQLYQ